MSEQQPIPASGQPPKPPETLVSLAKALGIPVSALVLVAALFAPALSPEQLASLRSVSEIAGNMGFPAVIVVVLLFVVVMPLARRAEKFLDEMSQMQERMTAAIESLAKKVEVIASDVDAQRHELNQVRSQLSQLPQEPR